MASKDLKLLIAASLITFFNIGAYFTFGIKQYLADRYLHYFNVTPQDVERIESNICTTSTIMSVFMGLLIKQISPSTICMLANFFLFLITVAVYVGVDFLNFRAVLFFAYLRGVFIEGIFLGQATLTVRLFTGQSLSLILGLTQVVNSLTTAVSSTLIPKVFNWSRSIPFCFFLGSLVAWVGVLLAVVCQVLEIYGWGAEISLTNQSNQKEAKELAGTLEQKEADQAPRKETTEGGDLLSIRPEPDKASYRMFGKDKDGAFSDLWDFNIWLNCFNYALGTTTDIILYTFGNELFVRRFDCDIEQAGLIMSLIPLLTIPFTPMYSAISMKYGKKTPMMMLGYAAGALAFLYVSILPKKLDSIWQLSAPIFLYAQCLSILHAFLYTNVGLVASSRILSVAFGISSLFFGSIYVDESSLFGILLKPDTAEVYQVSLLILAGLNTLGLLVTLLVFWVDMKRGKVLYLPENSPEVMEIKKKIDKGYKWFKKNYLSNRANSGDQEGQSSRIGFSGKYSLNNQLQSSERSEDFLRAEGDKRARMALSDRKEVIEGERDLESLS